MGLPPDLIELLSVFAEERVDYLLIGGQALAPPSRIDLMKEVPGGDFDAAYSARAWPAAARELRIGHLRHPRHGRKGRSRSRPCMS